MIHIKLNNKNQQCLKQLDLVNRTISVRKQYLKLFNSVKKINVHKTWNHLTVGKQQIAILETI